MIPYNTDSTTLRLVIQPFFIQQISKRAFQIASLASYSNHLITQENETLKEKKNPPGQTSQSVVY